LTRLETRLEKQQTVGTLLNIATTSRDGWNSRYTLIAGRDPLLQGEPAAAIKRTAGSFEKVLGDFRCETEVDDLTLFHDRPPPTTDCGSTPCLGMELFFLN
jgi:hypothetical protein